MIQAEQDVKKETIKHACRDFELTYEPGKPERTQEDEELVAALIKLHDFELAQQEFVDKMYKASIPVNKRTEEMRLKVQEITGKFKACADMADKLSDTSYIQEEASLDKLTEDQTLITEELHAHHGEMMKLYHDVVALQEMSNAFIKMDEDDMNALYDEYSEISYRHTQNYENNSINIVTYDDEYDKFLSFRDMRADRRKMLVDIADGALDNYTKLNLENTTLYDVWNEFTKRCNLIIKLAEMHGGILGSNFN